MAQGSTSLGEGTDGGAVAGFGVLTPRVPHDIGVRSQRQRILAAMAMVVAEKSISATTIADIVGCASISRATFYKHFTNKRECFCATAGAFLEELQGAAVVAYARSEDSPPASVRNVIAAMLELLATKPDHTKLLLLEVPVVDPEIVLRYRNFAIGALKKQLATEDGARQAAADPGIALGRAKVLIANHVAAGQVEDLPSLLPELVYIVLLPYVGQDAALEQARLNR